MKQEKGRLDFPRPASASPQFCPTQHRAQLMLLSTGPCETEAREEDSSSSLAAVPE